MPEGDAVRRTAARLDKALGGLVLSRAELRWPGLSGVELVGSQCVTTVAYGKHIFTRFDHGWTLHSHLRMDGAWRVVPTTEHRGMGRSTRAVLGNTAWTAVGIQLGMLDLVRTRDEVRLIAHLGPDVLADDFPVFGLPAAVERLLGAGGLPVAEALLDQRGVAGLGTIWVAESLWERRLWPWMAVRDVPDLPAVLLTARRSMQRAVVGEQRRHVHGRLGKACPRCATAIVIGAANKPPCERPVFYCPRCQAV